MFASYPPWIPATINRRDAPVPKRYTSSGRPPADVPITKGLPGSAVGVRVGVTVRVIVAIRVGAGIRDRVGLGCWGGVAVAVGRSITVGDFEYAGRMPVTF